RTTAFDPDANNVEAACHRPAGER
ncbi:MAG: hypothetical protein QOF08_2837, partial [Gaiellales bacterium]|nr:hypothetical protein [Gaiellales bacterium]